MSLPLTPEVGFFFAGTAIPPPPPVKHCSVIFKCTVFHENLVLYFLILRNNRTRLPLNTFAPFYKYSLTALFEDLFFLVSYTFPQFCLFYLVKQLIYIRFSVKPIQISICLFFGYCFASRFPLFSIAYPHETFNMLVNLNSVVKTFNINETSSWVYLWLNSRFFASSETSLRLEFFFFSS